MLYLWNWILRLYWCFISPKIREGPTFCYSIHPKAFIKLASVRIVELPISVLFAISPGAFIPVSVCLDTNLKFTILPHSTTIYSRFKNVFKAKLSYHIEWCPVRDSYPSATLPHRYPHSHSTSFPSHSDGPHSTPLRKLLSYCRGRSHSPKEIENCAI